MQSTKLIFGYMFLKHIWCPREDSNFHTLRHWFLRPACLPFHHLGIFSISRRSEEVCMKESEIIASRISIRWANFIFLSAKFKAIAWNWWAVRDSNPRRRSQGIYSPPHLTALVTAQRELQPHRWMWSCNSFHSIWSHLSDLNRRPFAYKASALPAELKWHISSARQILFRKKAKSNFFAVFFKRCIIGENITFLCTNGL